MTPSTIQRLALRQAHRAARNLYGPAHGPERALLVADEYVRALSEVERLTIFRPDRQPLSAANGVNGPE